MVEVSGLAERIFSLLKGNGLQVKIFDETGSETTDPEQGRRFFVVNPNIMVTVDEENNKVEFSKGKNVDDSIEALQKNIRKLADQFMMNSQIKVFGKSIQPRDYSYQAKNKGTAMMENNIRPINSHLAGQILQMVKTFGGKIHETDLSSNLGITDLNEIQPVLQHLVSTGKLSQQADKNGYPVYSTQVGGAMAETFKPGLPGIPQKQDTGFKQGLNPKNTDKPPSERGKFDKSSATDITFRLKESFSKMFGSVKTSQQTLENVRILVKHKTPIDENVRGSRSRHISAIFLESNGERFRFQHNYLPGARAMAQHMAHGGVFGDKVGSYIMESTGNLLKLQSFNRYVTTNKLINEDSSGIVETVKENIETLRTELKKLTGIRTYETVKARLETFERETLAEDDVSQLKELFTIRRFDEKFEGVLPIIKQLVQEKDTYHKRIEECAANVVMIRRESLNTTPMFEFASENARLGFKINEFALRIMENEELSEFINKIGNKICKEGTVNDFERAVFTQVLENTKVEEQPSKDKKEIKESIDLTVFFDKYMMNFY